MGDDLFRINLDVGTARSSGLVDKTLRLPAIRARLREIRDELGELAVQAFQSKVPYDTGYLRNKNIIALPEDKEGYGYSVRIVAQGTHFGRHGRSESASRLAQTLNDYKDRRSHVSVPTGPFSSSDSEVTYGWINEARIAFLSRYGVFLRKVK